MLEKLEKLAAVEIRLLPVATIETHFIFERNGFVALVEREGDEFGRIGTAGLATESGFAALVWRGGRAYFVRRGAEQPATDEQVESLRRFQKDLGESLT
jgi:hypothetical protein